MTELGVEIVKLQADLTGLKNGLRQGRQELISFRSMAQETADSVKRALSFAGVAFGLYELTGALKNFLTEAANYGARTEMLQVGMYQIGKNAGISAEALDYFTQKVKATGITTQEAMSAIARFLSTGLPLDKLAELATRARDIGVIAGTNTSETLNRMVQGIVSGNKRVLQTLGIMIPNVTDVWAQYAKSLGTTKDQLNSVQKAHAVLLAVLDQTARMAGTAAEADKTVGKQLASMDRIAKDAKESLWSLFQPAYLAYVQEMTQGWKDLHAWADANAISLANWGKYAAEWVRDIADAIRETIQFVSAHKQLIKTALELMIFSKAAGWVTKFAGALGGALTTIKTAATASEGFLATLTTLVGGPWKIAVIVSLFGLAEAKREIDAIQAKATLPGTTRPGFLWPWQLQTQAPAPAAPTGAALPTALRGRLTLEDLKKSGANLKDYLKTMGPDLSKLYEAEAQAAAKKAESEAPKPPAASTKGAADVLLGQYLSMIRAKRQADIQESQNALNLLQETNKLKKAEYDKDLAAGLIDGQEYYHRLQELQQQETTQALGLIEKKRQVQVESNQEALEQLAKQNMSAEAMEIARQKLDAQNRLALAKLEAEAAKVKLDGEVAVTNELRRQVTVRQQYQQKTEDLNLETAHLLGAITDQEESLQRLYLDWQRAKQEAIKAGAPPEYFTALEQNYQAKKLDLEYGGLGNSITSGFSSIIGDIAGGTRDLLSSTQNLFRGLIDEGIKPGLKQLQTALKQGFQELFGESGAGVASGVLGAVGLLGIMLTRGSSSSWSAAGASAGVTSSEAVRGVIAGPTSLPIGEIGASLADSLVPTNSILTNGFREVVGALKGGSPGGGAINVNLIVQGMQDSLKKFLDAYFAEYLMTGAG
jgi:hypothetical protein